MRKCKKCVSVLLAVLTILTAVTVGAVPGALKADAAGWNGYNYGGGKLYGYQTFLQAYGIDYDVYMKWLDDHDADSDNPDYYLGTPYVGEDHRNPHGDCDGAYGYYDTPGVEAMNCTGFVWHVLYKSALNSGASQTQIDRLGVMAGMPSSWFNYGVYRIYFDSLEDAYNSGVLEKGDLFWIYGTSDNHNAIFYGDSPKDFIYWDSAGSQNRYATVHAAGDCLGLWVAKVTQPNKIELHIDTVGSGEGTPFGTKYVVFDSKAKAQAVINNPDDDAAWDKREGTIVLNQNGYGYFRTQGAPVTKDLWFNNMPVTNHPYFRSAAKRVDSESTYYAVQWSHSPGISEDHAIHEFKDSGERTSSGYRIFRTHVPIKVKTPSFSTVKSVCDGVSLKWSKIKGAYQYLVYYKNRKGGWTRMAKTTGTSYLDKDVNSGTTYTYTIRCADKEGNFISDFNTSGWSLRYARMDTPKITNIESSPEGVKLSWNAAKGDDLRYCVYYKNSKGGWTRAAATADTSFTDTDVVQGKTYTYTLRCIDKDGDFVSLYNKDGWKYTYAGIDTPRIKDLTSTAEGVNITWDPVEGATSYRVYYKNGKGGWTKLTDTADTSCVDKLVRKGGTYTYTIRCINSLGKPSSGYHKSGWKYTYEGVKPQFTAAAGVPDGVLLKWESTPNSPLYRLYYKNSKGEWKKMADTEDTEYLDSDVSAGKTYTYAVRTVNSEGYFTDGGIQSTVSAVYEGVDTPQISHLESTAEGVSITWEPVENAAAYRIYYKNKKGGWTMMKETTDTSFTDAEVSKGKTYTYTVRCFNSLGKPASDYHKSGWEHTYTGVETPQITSINSEAEGIRMSWTPIEGVAKYRVYYKNKKGGWTQMAETEDAEYLDTAVNLGKNYYYTVRPVNSKGYLIGDADPTGWKCQYIGAPVEDEETDAA